METKDDIIILELEKRRIKSNIDYDKYENRPDKKRPIKFGDWDVDIHGNMDFQNGRYYLESDRLRENDWFIHIWGRDYAIWNDFVPAYFQACYNAGIKSINQLVHYENEK